MYIHIYIYAIYLHTYVCVHIFLEIQKSIFRCYLLPPQKKHQKRCFFRFSVTSPCHRHQLRQRRLDPKRSGRTWEECSGFLNPIHSMYPYTSKHLLRFGIWTPKRYLKHLLFAGIWRTRVWQIYLDPPLERTKYRVNSYTFWVSNEGFLLRLTNKQKI